MCNSKLKARSSSLFKFHFIASDFFLNSPFLRSNLKNSPYISSTTCFIFITLFILASYLIFKKHKYLFFKKHYLLLSYLALNYLIAWLFISFSEQIDYQQNDYLLRIILLFKLSSIPVLLTTWFFAWRTSLKKPLLHPNKIFLITISVIIILTSTYFSYPLYDRYKNSQSFNVTADDLETVSLIAESSGDENYIVLANQMLGAAAIDKYGFKHYYQNNF